MQCGRQSRGSQHHRDDGFVAVWVGLCLAVLLGFAGFCLDLGNAYLHIQRTQRAADAAALAGAPYLPENPALADSVAATALSQNGETSSNALFVGPDPNNAAYMKVTLKGHVPTALAQFIGFKGFDYSRSGRAAMRKGLGLGSPFNVLGIEPGSPSWRNGAGPAMEYYLYQSTQGRPKENSDRWAPSVCSGWEDGCLGTTNLENVPNPHPRDFAIEVTNATTGWLAIEMYDPTLRQCTTAACIGDYFESGVPNVMTNVAVWGPNAPTTGPPIATANCAPKSFPTDDSASSNVWVRICALDLTNPSTPPGKYTLRVEMPNSLQTNATNNYSLRAAFVSGPASSTLDVAKTKFVHVYAIKEFVSMHNANASLFYYLTNVTDPYAGQTLHAELYDFSEVGGASGITQMRFAFVDSNQEPSGCKLRVPTLGLSLAPSNGLCTFATSGIAANFNGRTAVVDLPIPTNYKCVATTQTSCWLSLAAQSGDQSFNGSSMSIEAPGTPVRLFPNS